MNRIEKKQELIWGRCNSSGDLVVRRRLLNRGRQDPILFLKKETFKKKKILPLIFLLDVWSLFIAHEMNRATIERRDWITGKPWVGDSWNVSCCNACRQHLQGFSIPDIFCRKPHIFCSLSSVLFYSIDRWETLQRPSPVMDPRRPLHY